MNNVFLLSHGLDNKYVNETKNINFICNFLSKNKINVAIIPNAKSETDRGCSLRTQQVLLRGGVQSTIFDLNIMSAELLNNFGCIYLSGGDPELLQNTIKTKVGTSQFKNLLSNKIVIGQSAGSMILSKNFINYSENNNIIKITKHEGLYLNNFDSIVVPHYGYLQKNNPKLIIKIEEYAKLNNLKILKLYDKQCYKITESGEQKLW